MKQAGVAGMVIRQQLALPTAEVWIKATAKMAAAIHWIECWS